MKASNDLFQLIKSLTKSEKGYFKKINSIHIRGEKNNYMRLFEAIDKQEVFDEHKIILQFKGDTFTNQLSVAKNYLYNLILKSLEQYYSSINSELRSLLNQLEILFNKKLFKQAEKILERAKKTAQKYENTHYTLQLFVWENRLLIQLSYKGKTKEEIEHEIHSKVFKELEKYKRYWEYDLLTMKLFLGKNNKGSSQSKEDIEYQKEIMNNPLLKKENLADIFISKYYFYICHHRYLINKDDLGKALLYAQKLVKLFEDNPHRIKERPLNYQAALQSLIICLIKINRLEEALIEIKKLKSLPTNSPIVASQLFYLANALELEVYLLTGEFEKVLYLIDEISPIFQENKEIKNEYELTFFYKVVLIYFTVENYSLANVYLNKILNNTTKALNQHSTYDFAHILSLITHFELGKLDLLHYEIRSTYNYLEKKGSLDEFERVFLDFLGKKLINVMDSKDVNKKFRKLKDKLLGISTHVFQNKSRGYFDFESWIDSKIERKPFIEIVKRKTLF